MSIITQVSDYMYEILQTTADKAAAGLGFVQRKRKLTGGSFIKTLVLGWFESPDASYADLANTAQDLGIDITRQGIAKRMTKDAAETLKTTLETLATQVLTVIPQCLPLLEQFKGVQVQDSTWIALPDELHDLWKGTTCKTEQNKASMKLQVRFDVLTGTFQHFQLTEGITADSKAEKGFQPLPAGSLRLADLGYFSLDTFEKLTQSGVYWQYLRQKLIE